MYRIGEIAKICHVSQKALRLYERKGLLKPAVVNDETGYRFYDSENIKTVEKIKNLKEIGMSLKQIKEIELNRQNLDKFIDQRFRDLQKAIRTLYLLENSKKGEFKMKNFINDENSLGKWEYLGSVKKKGEEIDSKKYFLNEIYFLENGQGYWLISGWSKGELYVYPYEYPVAEVYTYEIDGDKLYVNVMDDKTNQVDRIAIYKKVDSKKYNLKDLARKDDVNIPFQNDENVVGIWKGLAVVNNPETFNPNEQNFPSFIYDITFENGGELKIRYKDGRIANQKWTKGLYLNTLNSLAPKYQIKEINGKKFLFIENKNGDYIYNGHISSYLVFEKI